MVEENKRRIRRRRRNWKKQDCNTVVYSFSVHCMCLLLLRNYSLGGGKEKDIGRRGGGTRDWEEKRKEHKKEGKRRGVKKRREGKVATKLIIYCDIFNPCVRLQYLLLFIFTIRNKSKATCAAILPLCLNRSVSQFIWADLILKGKNRPNTDNFF